MSVFNQQLKQSVIWRGFYFITLLLVNIFLSRFLQADGAGILFYLANLFSFGVLLLSFNLDGGFTFFSSSKQIHHSKLAFLSLIWTIIIITILLIFLPFYFRFFDKEFNVKDLNLTTLGVYYIAGILLLNFFTALFYSLGNFFLPNLILGISNLFFIGLLYFGSLTNTTATDIVNDFFKFILFQGVLLAIVFYWAEGKIPTLSLPNSSELKQLLKYSSISLLGNFLFFFVYRLDYWFVKEWCLQSGELGNYIQASKFSQMLLIAPQILASTIFPQMASGIERKEIVLSIMRIFRILSVVFLVLFIIILLFGKLIFPFVFGFTFNLMYLPMLILLPGIFCLSFSTLLSAYFSGKKQNHINVYAAAFALVVMFIFTFLLKSQYSIHIAALISTLAYFSETLYCYLKFIKNESVKVKDFFRYSKADWRWLIHIFIK